MRRVWLLGMLAVVLAAPASVGACTSLKTAPPSGDAGAEDDAGVDDAGVEDLDGGDAASTEAGLDAGTPPPDFECPGDPWTKTSKSKAGCSARRVFVVDPEPAFDVNDLSIARTPAGRVGILYNSETDDESNPTSESGRLELVHFLPTTPTFATPAILARYEGGYMHNGFATKLLASGPDTLHVLAHDVDGNDDNGDVNVYRLVGGTAPLEGPDLVVGGVRRGTQLAFARDSSGILFATVRVATGASTAKLTAHRRLVGATSFEPLPDIPEALDTSTRRDVGAASIVTDAAGQLQLLFHYKGAGITTTPRFRAFDGVTWSYPKTIDEPTAGGLGGIDPHLALFGTKKLAVFFYRAPNQALDPKADLRLATWTSSDKPKIEILAQNIAAPDPTSTAFQVALAVDKYGLVHVVTILPSGATGAVEYRRQTRASNGEISWLVDVVDPDVGAGLVDLVVDENARPHIAYTSGKDALVRYATRFDR